MGTHQVEDAAGKHTKAVLVVHNFVVNIYIPAVEDILEQSTVDPHDQPGHPPRLVHLQSSSWPLRRARANARACPDHDGTTVHAQPLKASQENRTART